MLLLLTLRGTPTLYQGDELGIEDVPIPPELVQDPWEKNAPGIGVGRDPVRVPMPWEEGQNAGVTTGEPWLPMPPVSPAGRQAQDETSMLTLTRRILAVRQEHRALSIGDFALLETTAGVLSYARRHANGEIRVALNLSSEERPLSVVGRLLLSTNPARKDLEAPLAPGEGVVLAA